MGAKDVLRLAGLVVLLVLPSASALGCLEDGDCFGDSCCITDTSTCSSNDKASVLGGEHADDVCECQSNLYDSVSGECQCEDSGDCGYDSCCMATNECSSQVTGSVVAGDNADDACECTNGPITDGICECLEDHECKQDEHCCSDDRLCRQPKDEGACGDPHMTGFHGQQFDFTGNDGGWYALVSDPLSMHLNMRVTAPVPGLKEITYITGLSLLTSDYDGVEHSVIIAVKEPNNLESACPENVYPCLADGALTVVIDGGVVLVAPGTVNAAPGVKVTAVNIPGECRSFGFETYWEKKKMEHAQSSGRRLSESFSIGEWVLADPTATNMVECTTYVARAMSEDEGMFAHQSEHASFQIVTPTGTIRLSHGRLHQLPMRDPTDQYDLPDHLTWQMNMALDHNDMSHDAQGILGETFVPTLDEDGKTIMHGMECIRGTEEDYSVDGPLGVSFQQRN